MIRPLTAAALVAAALAAAALALRRMRTRSSESAVGVGPDAAGVGSGADDSSQGREWRCRCGQEYVVSGVDRHRVYWPAGASPDAALLDLQCVECGEPLPASREVTEA